MTVSEQRIDKLYLGLSAHERAVMRLRWFKEGAEDPPAFYRSTPDGQIPEINRLIRRFDATHHEISWYALWLRARLETVSVRLSALNILHLWALHTDRLRAQLGFGAPEPRLRTQRKAILEFLAEAPTWPPPAQTENQRTTSGLMSVLALRVAAELAGVWGEVLALDEVVRSEGEVFDGEEPIVPATREMLEEIRLATLALVERFKPDFGPVVLPEGPDSEILEAVTSIIAQQASE